MTKPVTKPAKPVRFRVGVCKVHGPRTMAQWGAIKCERLVLEKADLIACDKRLTWRWARLEEGGGKR